MRKKFGQNFLKIIFSCFAIILFVIILTGIFKYNKVIYEYNGIKLLVGIVIYIGLAMLFYKKVLPKVEKIKNVEWILFLIFTVIAISAGLYFKVKPTWDMGLVFELAKNYIKKGKFLDVSYLARFPNNIMMTIIEILILSGSRILGFKDYLTTITIVTAVIISISIIITFFIVKKISNRKNALMFLVICLFTSPLYLYAAEYYTDTFSMITTVLLFYIWLLINDIKKIRNKVFFCILYGFLLFVAIELKLTSAFVFVGIVIYEFMQGDMKELFKRLTIILPIVVICILLFNSLVVDKIITKEERLKEEIPKEHWIMMGMNGVGNFSFEEYEYTDSFQTYSEKKDAAIAKIKERLAERNIKVHFENIMLKIGFAWHDGTYWAPDVLRRYPVKKGILHEFILEEGEYSKYYKYIPQVIHFGMLIFILVNIIRILKDKEFESKEIISIITMFGLMLFLVIWENRSRYLVNILPLMIMSQINGIEYCSNCLKKLKEERMKK